MLARKFVFIWLLLSSWAWADLKIAVVDEQVVIDEYSRSKELVKTLEDSFRMKEKEMKALEEDLTMASREMRTASQSKKRQLVEKISKGKIELEVNKKYLTEYFTAQRNNFTMEVIKDIEEAIKVVGRDGGYDLVLRKAVPGPRGLEPQKTVFYNSDKLDITKKVLDYLNAQYSQLKK